MLLFFNCLYKQFPVVSVVVPVVVGVVVIVVLSQSGNVWDYEI